MSYYQDEAYEVRRDAVDRALNLARLADVPDVSVDALLAAAEAIAKFIQDGAK